MCLGVEVEAGVQLGARRRGKHANRGTLLCWSHVGWTRSHRPSGVGPVFAMVVDGVIPGVSPWGDHVVAAACEHRSARSVRAVSQDCCRAAGVRG